MNDTTIEQAQDRALDFIARNQKPDGAFEGLSGSRNFITSLVLLSLGGSDSAQARQIAEKGARFLISERSSEWSWNYWPRGSAEAAAMPYPDDLDDTACALAAISRWIPDSVSGKALAWLTKHLARAEIQEGGPYGTWMLREGAAEEWRDCDVAVNSNVARLLRMHEIATPSIEAFIEECIAKGSYPSLYYRSPIVILYFISRSYRGQLQEKAASLILNSQNPEGSWSTGLETALATTSLLSFGVPPEKCAASAGAPCEAGNRRQLAGRRTIQRRSQERVRGKRLAGADSGIRIRSPERLPISTTAAIIPSRPASRRARGDQGGNSARDKKAIREIFAKNQISHGRSIREDPRLRQVPGNNHAPRPVRAGTPP